MPFVQSDAIEIRRVAGKGRGVFARRRIRRGELIERVPVIVVSENDFQEHLCRTKLDHYCFGWDGGKVVVSLGYGSIYNHSYQPNARCDAASAQSQEFRALREIAPNEEITVNYNGKPRSQTSVWFEVIDAGSNGKK